MADTKKKSAPAKKESKPKVARAPKAAAPAKETRVPIRAMLLGLVVSDKMSKTIVVKVDRTVRHGQYKKIVVRSRKFKAHDEKNDAKIGDLVRIVSCRPMSRDKCWALQEIVRRGGAAARELNVVG